MKVFTFLGPVEGKQLKEEFQLVDLWKKSWHALGWIPVVLTPDSLLNDKETARLLKKFSRLPSKNKRKLDMWCYARWLAVAQHGGGFMCDYDVINYSFEPEEFSELTCYSGVVPCLMSGSAEEFHRGVGWFDELQQPPFWKFWDNGEHISDMLVLKNKQDEAVKRYDCVNFGESGWESAPAVHYSNFAMKPKGYMPRHEWIPQLRALL
jgi:hypothetical protein